MQEIEHTTHVADNLLHGIQVCSAPSCSYHGTAIYLSLQNDNHSCGVCVINAIKTYIHGGEVFTHVTHFKHHLEYFIEVTN